MSDGIEIEGTFLIADLSGYTALTEAHGNLHAADAVARYREIADSVLAPGVIRLEQVGDELLLTARDTKAIVRTAVALLDAIENEPDFPTIRAGIHRGSVVERDGRYYGAALNMTARVAGHARGGQILCTASAADPTRDLSGIEIQPAGVARFRNVAAPVELFEIVRSERRSVTLVDPVCRMQIRTETAPARLPWKERTYYFCSFECARSFAASPETYASEQ